MTRQSGNVIRFPEVPRLLFDDFMQQAQDHCSDIAATQSALVYAHNLFREGKNIYPDQCDDILDSIGCINEPVQDFCGLLASFAHLPIAVGPLRYPLLRALHQIDELVNELTLLITLFKTTCRTSSKLMITQRKEIQRKLELLVQHIEEVGPNVDDLPTQVQFAAQASSCR